MGYVSGSCYYIEVNKCKRSSTPNKSQQFSKQRALNNKMHSENCTKLSCMSYIDTFLNSLSPV